MTAAPTLLESLRAGDRRALARAITLVESSRSDDRREAEALIDAILPTTGNSVRIGISGPPGAVRLPLPCEQDGNSLSLRRDPFNTGDANEIDLK